MTLEDQIKNLDGRLKKLELQNEELIEVQVQAQEYKFIEQKLSEMEE